MSSLPAIPSTAYLSEGKLPNEILRLENVQNIGDTVASPNYGSRVEGHVVSVGGGKINIKTINSHNYSITPGAVVNINPEALDERFKVLSWLDGLANLDFYPTHRANIAHRCDGVGAWVLNDETLRGWLQGTFRVLWIHGIRGCGKTVLAYVNFKYKALTAYRALTAYLNVARSTIIEHLDIKENDSACLFIFFDYLQKAAQTSYNLTVDLLKQLVSQHSVLSGPVRKMYTEYKNRSSPPMTQELLNVINLESKRFGKVHLVVDGLDECPAHATDNTREPFFNLVRSLSTTISLLFTARNANFERYSLGEVTKFEYAPTQDDMETYVRAQIQKHSAYNDQLTNSNHDAIIEAVTRQAKGMLLLARLHVNDIAAQHTSVDLQSALAELPSDAHHTYEKAMQRISHTDKKNAERVFVWLTSAMRTLTVEELRSALAVNKNVTSVHTAEGHMYSIKYLVDICEGLIIVDEQAKPHTVSLVHPTARAFFETYFSSDRAHKTLALTCLRYLQFEDLKAQIQDLEGILTRFQKLPFLRYAALHWGNHVHRAQDIETTNLAAHFLQARVSLTATAQAMDPSEYEPASGLYLAAHFGLKEVVTKLLTDNPKIIQEQMYGETPLHAASREGHADVVQILLHHELNPDQRNEDGRTSLSLATENGHLAVVKLLVYSGKVDINSPTTRPFYKGRTPLSWAVGNGHATIIEHLLTIDGMDVDAAISEGLFAGRTPLMFAALNGYEEIVELLLTKGKAAACMTDSEGMSALALAAQEGHTSTAKLLLLADPATPRLKDSIYNRRPVEWALERGHEAVIELFLKHPSIDAKDDMERTTLSYEAEYGNLNLVQRLLDWEADPNSTDEEDWTPLTYAAYSGHIHVVKVLLERGADLQRQTVDHRTPLSFASQEGHVEIVQLLLQECATPNLPDRFGRTPLSYAAGGGRIEVVEALLRYDIDINLKESYTSWTQAPILLAAANGHEEVVRRLLSTGKITLTPDAKLFGEPAIKWAMKYGLETKIQPSQ